MIEDGHVTRISVFGAMGHVRTHEGIGIGSSGASVRHAYQNVEREAAAYDGPPAYDLYVWQVRDHAGLRFEVGADGKVNAMHGGTNSIGYMEGCM